MPDPRIDEAIQYLRLVTEAESTNRAEGLDALKFRWGDQWPVQIQNSRTLESRPCLTINFTDTMCQQIENQQRQQRPRIKVDPTNGEATKQVGDVIQGMLRHCEVARAGADLAYDTAFRSAVTCGFGYFRLMADYVRPDTFDQEIYYSPIDNPFTVYFDPDSTLPDGSDAKRCLISSMMNKQAFEREYPGADIGGFVSCGTGDSISEWISREEIRVAEYYRIVFTKHQLIKLSNGIEAWQDRMPSTIELIDAGLQIIATRPSWRPQVKWCKLTAMEVLEERDIPGRYIPVVPVYGTRVTIDSKRKKSGVVRNAMDPQRMVNFHETSATESIAMAPKAKWLLAEGQDEGYENEFAQANVSARAVLHYKQTDIDGREAPPPTRNQPEPPPVGTLELLQKAEQNLRSVVGVIDPGQRISGNISGKALQGEKQQSDNATFHYYDNLTASIRHGAKIALEWIPVYYDTERVVRIVGDDGRPSLTTINSPHPDPAVAEVLNDVTVGEYDIVMDTGPGYNSKRQEAVATLMPLLEGNEKLMDLIGDLVFRNMDFPGSDVIADRLAAANPLAQIDEESDVPPAAQMKIKQLMQQVQQLTQQLQAAGLEIKNRQSIEQMKQQGETQRKHMELVTKAHDVNSRDQTLLEKERLENAAWMHEVEMKAASAQGVEEIKATVQLLLHHLASRDLDKQLEHQSQQTETAA